MVEKNFITLAGFTGIAASILSMLAVLGSIFLCGVGCGEGAQATEEWGSGDSFSWKSNALSDLGESRVATIFNYPLILAGIMFCIFTVGLVRAYAGCALFRLGGVFAVLGGVSISLLGTFTRADGFLHSWASAGYFAFIPLAMILIGFAFVRRNMRTRGYMSISAGNLALLIIITAVTLQWHTSLGLGLAIPEIIGASLIAAWIIWMGIGLVRSQGKAHATKGTAR